MFCRLALKGPANCPYIQWADGWPMCELGAMCDNQAHAPDSLADREALLRQVCADHGLDFDTTTIGDILRAAGNKAEGRG